MPLIELEDAKKALQYNTVIMHEHTNPHHTDNGIFLLDALKQLDEVKPASNNADWEEIEYTSIEHGEVISTPAVRCTKCKRTDVSWNKDMNYCPNCGAKMR